MLQETERRVLGNLSEPRSLPNLTRVLCADNHGPFDDRQGFDQVKGVVSGIVSELLGRGLVTKLGSHSEAKSVLRAIREGKDSIDLPTDKAGRLAERLDSPRDSRLDTGELFILSKDGLGELTA